MNRNHHHPNFTENLFQYDNLLEFEFGKNCTAECIKEVVERLEMYKTASILYQSLKVNEDGSLPPFQFRDVLNYYIGEDHLVQDKNIQDFFTINILDLNFPDTFQELVIKYDIGRTPVILRTVAAIAETIRMTNEVNRGIAAGIIYSQFISISDDHHHDKIESHVKKTIALDPTAKSWIRENELHTLSGDALIVRSVKKIHDNNHSLENQYEVMSLEKKMANEVITAISHGLAQALIGSYVGHKLDESFDKYVLEPKKGDSSLHVIMENDLLRDYRYKINQTSTNDLLLSSSLQLSMGVCLTLLIGNGVSSIFRGDPNFGVPFYLTFFGTQEKLLTNIKEINKRL
ncbi:hypothetical protein ACTFIT_004074 [Dictyostelium discoideum]